jgi:hypothetical protein
MCRKLSFVTNNEKRVRDSSYCRSYTDKPGAGIEWLRLGAWVALGGVHIDAKKKHTLASLWIRFAHETHKNNIGPRALPRFPFLVTTHDASVSSLHPSGLALGSSYTQTHSSTKHNESRRSLVQR